MTAPMLTEPAPWRADDRPIPTLTDREREITALVREGMTNAEIGRELYLSPRTVQSHIATAMDKLAVGSRTGLAVRAIRLGLVPLHRHEAPHGRCPNGGRIQPRHQAPAPGRTTRA